MIDALRSGDITKIARYSDLTIPDVDRKILELGHLLRSNQERIDTAVKYGGNEQAIRLHNMLVDMGYVSELLEPLINRAFENHPGLVMKDLMPLILSWYQSAEIEKTASSKPKMKAMKKADWHTLDSNDLRFLFSQSANEEAFLESLSREGLLFDAENWINSFG